MTCISACNKGPVSFKDVSTNFIQAEWQWLDSTQKILYSDVMLENCSNLVSVRYCITKPEEIIKLEQEAPWISEEEFHADSNIPPLIISWNTFIPLINAWNNILVCWCSMSHLLHNSLIEHVLW
uniref:KRAB domain-containing protein n=1 Tax=Capra hircus TaxID=9925 RepID=A0A8C2XW76_CAPHI